MIGRGDGKGPMCVCQEVREWPDQGCSGYPVKHPSQEACAVSAWQHGAKHTLSPQKASLFLQHHPMQQHRCKRTIAGVAAAARAALDPTTP